MNIKRNVIFSLENRKRNGVPIVDITFIVLLGIALLAFGCGVSSKNGLNGDPVAERVTIDGVEFVSADITALRDTVTLPLSMLAENIRIIPLETRPEALFESGSVTISENYIGITTSDLRSFRGCFKI